MKTMKESEVQPRRCCRRLPRLVPGHVRFHRGGGSPSRLLRLVPESGLRVCAVGVVATRFGAIGERPKVVLPENAHKLLQQRRSGQAAQTSGGVHLSRFVLPVPQDGRESHCSRLHKKASSYSRVSPVRQELYGQLCCQFASKS